MFEDNHVRKSSLNNIYFLGDVGHRSHLPFGKGLAPSQWEKLLQCNTISHWLGANLESVPSYHPVPDSHSSCQVNHRGIHLFFTETPFPNENTNYFIHQYKRGRIMILSILNVDMAIPFVRIRWTLSFHQWKKGRHYYIFSTREVDILTPSVRKRVTLWLHQYKGNRYFG